MEIKKYTKKDESLWNDFVRSAKNSLFMHDRNFMEYHADRFEDASLLFYEEDEAVALLPLSVKDNVLYSHAGLTFGGFITSTKMKQHRMNEMFEALLKYMSDNSYSKLIYKAIPYIYCTQPAEEDLYALYKFGAKLSKMEASTVVDLQNALKIPKGRKAQITRAKREGVVVEESDEFDSFIELENKVLSEYHNTKAVHSGVELKLLHERFPNNLKLFVGKYKDKIISGSVIFIYANTIHTQYLAADDVAREIGALDLVVATLMENYKSTKKWFDFGKSTEGDGKYLNEGLISQKESFGGRTCVYQTWEIDR